MLVALPNNAAILEKIQEEVAERARRMLSPWVLDPNMFGKLEGRLKLDILYPAIKLHQDIRVSSHHYYLDSRPMYNDSTPKAMLDCYQVKSVHDWGPAKRANQIGEVLGCLHPALLRLRSDGETVSTLSKAVIVVARPENETKNIQQARSENIIAIANPAIKELQSTPPHIRVEQREDDESVDDESGSENSDLEGVDVPAYAPKRMSTWPTSQEPSSDTYRVDRSGNDAPMQSTKEQGVKQGHREGNADMQLIIPDRGVIGRNKHVVSAAPSQYSRRESAKDIRSRDQSVRGKSVAIDENSKKAPNSPQKEPSSKGPSFYSKSKTAITTTFLGPLRNPPPPN